MFQNKVRKKVQERKLPMQCNPNFALRSQNIKESISLAKLCSNSKWVLCLRSTWQQKFISWSCYIFLTAHDPIYYRSFFFSWDRLVEKSFSKMEGVQWGRRGRTPLEWIAFHFYSYVLLQSKEGGQIWYNEAKKCSPATGRQWIFENNNTIYHISPFWS